MIQNTIKIYLPSDLTDSEELQVSNAVSNCIDNLNRVINAICIAHKTEPALLLIGKRGEPKQIKWITPNSKKS